MCSMLLRLVSALLTLLFVGSVHLYIMWETVRRPYVLVAMSAPQTVAHFCTWQRKWLCYWKRASAASLLWLCGILNQKGWWKCSPTFFRGPIATTRVFQGHRFPPLITSTYTHTHTHTCVMQVVREATARFLWQRSSKSDKASKSGCLMPLTVFRSQRTWSTRTHTHTNSPGQANVERLTDWCRCLYANPQVTCVYFCLWKACACHADVWLVYARHAAGACVFL